MIKPPIRILLVEDNPADALLMQKILENAKTPYSLEMVEDGDMAIKRLNSANGLLPQIVLLDMNMPKKNGIEVLEEIKAEERFKHIPVIMLTSSKSEKDVIRSYAAGAASYVSKPINVEDHKKLLRALTYSIHDYLKSEFTIMPSQYILNCHYCRTNEVKTLNRENRQKDRDTDVLSFPMYEDLNEATEGVPVILGDIYISLDQAKTQAVEYNIDLSSEQLAMLQLDFLIQI